MDLRFFGATGTTTGSCHMLRIGNSTVLLDCGLFPRSSARGAELLGGPRTIRVLGMER